MLPFIAYPSHLALSRFQRNPEYGYPYLIGPHSGLICGDSYLAPHKDGHLVYPTTAELGVRVSGLSALFSELGR
jgi:hypothetical protein